MSGSITRLNLHYIWFGTGYLLLLCVAIVSLIPIPDSSGVSDKFMHFITYFILSSWFSLIVEKRKSLLRVCIGLILYGIMIELVQGMTIYRSAEFADAIANSLGVFVGLAFHFTPLHRFLRWLDAILYRFWQ